MQKIKEGNVDPKWPPMLFCAAFHHFHPPEISEAEAFHSFPPQKKISPQKRSPKGVLNPNDFLVGGFNPFEKYAGQIGSFPQGSG